MKILQVKVQLFPVNSKLEVHRTVYKIIRQNMPLIRRNRALS